jgi:hypothetical protein
MLKKSFKIDNNIYDSSSIKQAINDFSEAYNIEFNDNSLIIEAENENEAKEVFGEFMNYVLGIQNI